MKKFLILMLLFIGVHTLFAQETSPKVKETKTTMAVLDLTGKGADASALNALTNIVIGEIAKSNQYELLDRANMQSILKEQGLQQSLGCTNEQCAVEMGQVLGVKNMLFGSVEKLGKTYILTLKVVDVETAKIVNIKSHQYRGEMEGLIELTKQLTNYIIGLRDTIDVVSQEPKKEIVKVKVDTTKVDTTKEEKASKEVVKPKKKIFRQFAVVSYSHRAISDFTSSVYSQSSGWKLVDGFNINMLADTVKILKATSFDIFSKLPKNVSTNIFSLTGYITSNFGFNFGYGSYSRVAYSGSNDVKLVEDNSYILAGLKLNMYKRKFGPFIKFDYVHGVSTQFDIYDKASLTNTYRLKNHFEPSLNGAFVEAGLEVYFWHIGLGVSYGYNWMGFSNFQSTSVIDPTVKDYLYIYQPKSLYIVSHDKLDNVNLKDGYVLSGGSLNIYVNVVFGKNK